ncbi:MAG: HIT family protein [Deltaproteobacteria bacterium]|nr:HIT family protein [Deltaproteobacteria bacterium]
MRDCIFCKIVAGLAPAARVHEDELTVSFMDLFPASRGHLLVVPKRHFSDILGADEASLVRVAANSRRIALALKRALAPDGIGVHQLNGAAAGQTVFHYHMHLIPRRMGDPLGLHGRRQASELELAEVAALISEALLGIP